MHDVSPNAPKESVKDALRERLAAATDAASRVLDETHAVLERCGDVERESRSLVARTRRERESRYDARYND